MVGCAFAEAVGEVQGRQRLRAVAESQPFVFDGENGVVAVYEP